jgi:hypothetical protein
MFKVGDKVRLKDTILCKCDTCRAFIKHGGVIIHKKPNNLYSVKICNGVIGSGYSGVWLELFRDWREI